MRPEALNSRRNYTVWLDMPYVSIARLDYTVDILSVAVDMACLTNNKLALVVCEAVLRYLEIQRCRSTSNTSRDIVVRSVARAVPATVVSCFTDRYTSQVGADSQHDEPFGCEVSRNVVSSVVQDILDGTYVSELGRCPFLGHAET